MRPSLWRRGLSAALVTTAVAGAVVTGGGPATASRGIFLPTTSFARTDISAPHTTITTGDAIVGAYRGGDGRRHVSKSYFTFDLTQFAGRQVVGSAEINLLELAANDCATARATEVWLTTPPRKAPTWANAPKEILRLTGPGSTTGCPPQWIGFGAGDALRKALAAGWDTMTVVVRVARGKQGDLAYGRTYSTDTGLYAEYDTAPDTPTNLTVGYRPCGAEPVWTASRDVELQGAVSDPDGDFPLTTRLAYWPVDDPAARVEKVTTAYSSFSATIPQAELADGRSYTWQVRAEDADGLASGWSEPCAFTLDWTPPSAPPTVASETYPPDGGPPGGGGEGVPGDFTFTANGVADVGAFEYQGIGMPSGRVNADQLGGSATVSLTPGGDGPLSLTVWSIDRGGNRSSSVTYRFWVRSTAPLVDAPSSIMIGERFPATFTARQDGATTFTYQLDGQPEVTVPVGADGTAAVTVDVPASEDPYHQLIVWSTDAAGARSGAAAAPFTVDLGEPAIELQPLQPLLDQPVEVTLRPGMPDVVSYTYWSDPAHKVTVPAEADGMARFTFTPDGFGTFLVQVFSTTAAGLNSGVAEGYGWVQSSEPEVTSTDYPAYEESGAPGTPGTFHFTSPIPNVTEFRYSFDYGPEVAVPAAADGTATVTLTPTSPGYKSLRVHAVTTGGRDTGTTYYTLRVNEVRPLVEGVPPTPVAAGTQVELTLTATQPGAVEFRYVIRGAETVVPAVDGKATVTVTASDPNGWGSMDMSVYSRTPDGAQSGETYVQIPITTA